MVRITRIIMAFSGLPGVPQTLLYERWTSKGIYSVDSDQKSAGECLDTPFPVTVGSKWVANGPSETQEMEVIGMETVALPERSYKNCLKLSFKNSPRVGAANSGIEYLAPKIRLVKMDIEGGTKMTITIKSTNN